MARFGLPGAASARLPDAEGARPDTVAALAAVRESKPDEGPGDRAERPVAGPRTAMVCFGANAADGLRSPGSMPLPAARIHAFMAAERGLPGRPGPVTLLAGVAERGAGPGSAVVYEDALSGVCFGRVGNGPGDALRSHGADLVVTDLAQLLDDEGKAGTDDDPQR